MIVKERLASVSETHKAWCEQVVGQRAWVNPWDAQFDAKVNSDVASIMGRAWACRGKGRFDSDVTKIEIDEAVASWDASNATTPDLIPRCVFRMGHDMWDKIVRYTMAIVGPGRLAISPRC